MYYFFWANPGGFAEWLCSITVGGHQEAASTQGSFCSAWQWPVLCWNGFLAMQNMFLFWCWLLWIVLVLLMANWQTWNKTYWFAIRLLYCFFSAMDMFNTRWNCIAILSCNIWPQWIWLFLASSSIRWDGMFRDDLYYVDKLVSLYLDSRP